MLWREEEVDTEVYISFPSLHSLHLAKQLTGGHIPPAQPKRFLEL